MIINQINNCVFVYHFASITDQLLYGNEKCIL